MNGFSHTVQLFSIDRWVMEHAFERDITNLLVGMVPHRISMDAASSGKGDQFSVSDSLTVEPTNHVFDRRFLD